MSDDLTKDVQKNKTNIALLTQKMGQTHEKIDKLCDKIEKDTDQTRKSLKGIDDAFRGKDSENPGLFVRMDRQEQWAKRSKAIIGTIGTALLGMILAFFTWLLGFFGKGNQL